MNVVAQAEFLKRALVPLSVLKVDYCGGIGRLYRVGITAAHDSLGSHPVYHAVQLTGAEAASAGNSSRAGGERLIFR